MALRSGSNGRSGSGAVSPDYGCTKVGIAAPPLSIGPTVAFTKCGTLCLIAALLPIGSSDCKSSDCKKFLEVVRGHVNRARIRLATEQGRSQVGEDREIRDQDADIILDPLDDKLALPVSHEALLAQTSFPVWDPT